MSTTIKHWLDVIAAILTAISAVATPLVSLLTAILGAIWYYIRIRDWLNERKDNGD